MKIKGTHPVEVYVGDGGYLHIHQTTYFTGPDGAAVSQDEFVTLSPEQARAVILALEHELKTADVWWSVVRQDTK